MEFDNLNWHDSIIMRIEINRENPGENDIIQMKILWPDNKTNIISFKGVYWANFDMNFGIANPESILKAHSESRGNEMINNLYERWQGMLKDVDLYYYEIETNSTNSKIRIIARDFVIEKH